MSKSSIIVLLLILCIFTSILSLPLVSASSVMWNQTYGGEFGQVVYSFDIAYSLVETRDGGFALVGTRFYFGSIQDSWFIKTDRNGNVQWNHTYSGGIANSLVVTSDDGYAFAGGTLDGDFWLVKTDGQGNVEWNQTFGEAETEQYASSLIVTSDEGFALAGYSEPFGHGTRISLLVKTDKYGNMEWNKTFLEMSSVSLVQTFDGGFAMSGEDGNYDGLLVKTDTSGNQEWIQTYGRDGVDFIHSLFATSDGGFALGGSFGTFLGQSFWLIKTDSYGDVLWNQTYGEGIAYSLIETSDAGFALAGKTHYGSGFFNLQIIKTNANGKLEWNQTYGGEEYDTAHSLVETFDGGYAIAGETYSFSVGASDFWLIKTNEYGIIPEFPSWIVLPLFLVIGLASVILKKRMVQDKIKDT